MRYFILFSFVVLSVTINCQKTNNSVKLPPMGWNSWEQFGCKINETLIMEISDAIVSSGIYEIGYEYIIIEDCWQSGRDSLGFLIVDEFRFPSGIKSLADYVHNIGLKLTLFKGVGVENDQSTNDMYINQDNQLYNSWGVDFINYDVRKRNVMDSYKSIIKGSRAEFSMKCMFNDAIFISNDPRNFDEKSFEIIANKGAIAVNQDKLAIQAFKINSNNGLDIWAKPLEKDEWAICFINTDSLAREIIFDWKNTDVIDPVSKKHLNLKEKKFHIYNVWEYKIEGTTKKVYKSIVTPNDVIFLLLIN
ncbi:MAG: alpha-galactosidase [Marinilabiliaceae bacterium]|nr:alpha-galactosidase [Marinilabiliaceae bacterium]